MGKKVNSLGALLKSNKLKMINAAIKSNFLANLVINESMAYKNLLSNIYTGNKSKQDKAKYLSTLKNFWEKNKDSLTVEIMQLKEKSGDSANLNKDLSKEEINSNNVLNLSENKCDSEIGIVSDSETKGNMINKFIKDEKINSSNSEDVCDLPENKCDSEIGIVSDCETEGNMINKFINVEKTNSNKLSDVFELSEKKCDSDIENMSDCETDSNNSDDVFDLSGYKFDSEMESVTCDTEERSEFRTLEPILRIKKWTVSKAKISKICDLKTHKLLGGWYNIVYDDYISKHNPYCVLVFRRTHVKKKGSIRKNLPLFRTRATCKHSTCKTTHIFTIHER